MNRVSVPPRAAIVIFVVGCLVSIFRIAHDAPSAVRLHPDDIKDRSDKRFAALKTELPSHGVVGYVGESDDSALPDYYLAQYALAPVVVDRGTKHPLVIGNFPHSQTAPAEQGLTLLRDFGDGVALFANRGTH
ncbi:MAG TPA: hypothetical protein VGS27_12065 [Candidatus Sulfotelmatobacter sp.]|nr:hypothetical protein [Candidatus Sulfotelmatobacter sp.]